MVGVDPGASGAIAILRDGAAPEIHDMPVGKITVGKTTRDRISPELLGDLIRSLMPVDAAYVEEVASRPGQGVSAVFTFGQAHGLILGAFSALGVRIVRVRPQTWQVATKSRGDPRVRALELYPGQTPHLKRVKDAGRADALLIAHYGLTLERTNP